MIRDIKPLQSSDQTRLREHARQNGRGDFARILDAASNDETGDPRLARPGDRHPALSAASLLRHDATWSQLIARMGNQNDNDNQEPLFHWGETRAHAREHAQTARQSARLNGSAPLHILNEEI